RSPAVALSRGHLRNPRVLAASQRVQHRRRMHRDRRRHCHPHGLRVTPREAPVPTVECGCLRRPAVPASRRRDPQPGEKSLGIVKVEDLPDGVRSQLPRLLPRLGVAPASTDDGQHVLFEAILEVLAYAAARTKLVLVIDDVHWIDPASRELLRYVTSNLRRVPMLVVVAYRPEDSTDDRALIAQLGRLGSHPVAPDPL